AALTFVRGDHDGGAGSPEGGDKGLDDLSRDGGMVHEAEHDGFEAGAFSAIERPQPRLKRRRLALAIRLVDDHQYVAQVHGPPDLIRVVAQHDGYACDAAMAQGANDCFDKRVPAVSE